MSMFGNLRNSLDREAIQEDMRKLGIGLAGGGLFGVIVNSDKITAYEGFVLLFLGSILWVFGIQKNEE